MKQIWMMVVVGLFIIVFSSLAFTQEHKDMKQGDKICQEKMKRLGHCCETMKGKSLVPTENCGVVVMCCNKLFKYDKDLVLQKVVEIKMEKCPMSKKMKIEGETKAAPK